MPQPLPFAPNQLTADTLAILKGMLAPGNLKKAGWIAPTSAISGINYYDLELGALQLFPVITPIRDRVPRASAEGGIQANWRAITGINTTHLSPGLSEGHRNAALTHTTADYFASFRELGFDDYITWKAEYAAKGFDDAKALTVSNLLRATMIGEEMVDLGGNTSLALSTTPTPTLAGSTTGGSLAAQTWSVIVVALTNDGYIQVAGTNVGTTGEQVNVATATLTASVSRTNMDGSTDTYGGGVAQKSAAATVVTTGSTSSISASVAAVTGAYAYAWFWGASGSELLGAVTTINSVLIKAAATGSFAAATLPSSDNSTNSLVYDGFLTMLAKGLGSYYAVQPTGTAGTGTPLTSDGAAGIVEVNNAFSSFWNLYRLSPDLLLCNAQEMLNMNSKVVAGGGAPLYRFNLDASGVGATTITAGVILGSLLNKITGELCKVMVHPNMPPGTMMFWDQQIPYPLSGVREVIVKRLRYDYRALEWPMVKRQYEYGVYFDGVLQNYFFPSFGLITNIGNG